MKGQPSVKPARPWRFTGLRSMACRPWLSSHRLSRSSGETIPMPCVWQSPGTQGAAVVVLARQTPSRSGLRTTECISAGIRGLDPSEARTRCFPHYPASTGSFCRVMAIHPSASDPGRRRAVQPRLDRDQLVEECPGRRHCWWPTGWNASTRS